MAPRLQSRGESFSADVCAPKRGLENGVVVRQHADDDLAVEQIGDLGRGPETECRELVHPVRATDIGDYPTPRGGKVCRHRRAHVTEADKADFALFGRRGRGCATVSDGGVGLGSSIGRLLIKR